MPALLQAPSAPKTPSPNTQGHVFVNQYLLIQDLGRGAHGSVKLVYSTEDDRVYAMKVRAVMERGPADK